MGLTEEEPVDILYTDFSNGFGIPVCGSLINNLEKHDLDETTVMQNCTNSIVIDCSPSKWEGGECIDWCPAGAGSSVVHYFKRYLSS